MALFLLTTLTMIAFAGNSVLNRAAVAVAGLDAVVFSVVRVACGAAMLGLLVGLRVRRIGGGGGGLPRPGWGGPVALAAYMLGFSLAYRSLDAGIGALILFGGVQITMFAAAVVQTGGVPARRWVGAGVALAGLGYLLWPGDAAAVDLPAALLMAVAALGWGIYSVLGRRTSDPLAATAVNFALCLPVTALGLVWAEPGALPAALAGSGPAGLGLAALSGAVTSGMGYALWYAVLPRLATTTAAVAQLSVPVIAVAAGALILSEPVSARIVLSAALVLGGIAVSLTGRRG